MLFLPEHRANGIRPWEIGQRGCLIQRLDLGLVEQRLEPFLPEMRLDFGTPKDIQGKARIELDQVREKTGKPVASAVQREGRGALDVGGAALRVGLQDSLISQHGVIVAFLLLQPLGIHQPRIGAGVGIGNGLFEFRQRAVLRGTAIGAGAGNIGGARKESCE